MDLKEEENKSKNNENESINVKKNEAPKQFKRGMKSKRTFN